MDWFKLKENKCPKCGKDITKGMIIDTASQQAVTTALLISLASIILGIIGIIINFV